MNSGLPLDRPPAFVPAPRIADFPGFPVRRGLRAPGVALAAAVLAAGCAAPEAERAPEESSAPPASRSSEELLEESIAYHDPEGVWDTAAITLRIVESRPDRPPRTTEIRMDAGAGRVAVSRDAGEGTTRFETLGEEIVSRSVDGDESLTEEALADAGLGAEAVMRLRNYYLYLWGLPMKLRDPGAIIEPEPAPDTWEGEEALRVRVTYDPEVGGDTWYFFFDPETARLVGYRFHHDEAENDGEYILLSGEIEGGGLRLPAKRSWYWNDGGGFLGDDEAVALEAESGEGAR